MGGGVHTGCGSWFALHVMKGTVQRDFLQPYVFSLNDLSLSQ
jgi:hypothetical protein